MGPHQSAHPASRSQKPISIKVDSLHIIYHDNYNIFLNIFQKLFIFLQKTVDFTMKICYNITI